MAKQVDSGMATGTTGTSGGGFMRSTLISLAAWTPGNSWTEMALAMLAVAVCKAAVQRRVAESGTRSSRLIVTVCDTRQRDRANL